MKLRQPAVVAPPQSGNRGEQNRRPNRGNQYRYGNRGYGWSNGGGYGGGYRRGYGGYAYSPGGYNINGVTAYAPPGYYYDPVNGFVPYSLGLPGYGYGYTTSGVVGSFGSGTFGSGVGGWGGGVAVPPIAVPPIAVPPIARPPLAPPVVAARPAMRQSVLVDTRIDVNPHVAAVEVELFNSGKRDIDVALSHLVSPDQSQQFRIPAGGSVKTMVDRDAGSQKISVYETYDALGNLITKEVGRDIRPEVLYEVIVHEWAVQSVAIDRTGKSPNVIEDINMQGRGIGRFSLPPGERFRGGRIDVYGAAKAADNAGTIQPITSNGPADSDNADRLDRAIFEAQLKAQQAARRGGR